MSIARVEVSELTAPERVLKDMKLKAFAEWLRKQPAKRAYTGDLASQCCPIAYFCGYRVASHIFGMPRWASRFIDRFDGENKPTQQSALKALAIVESEFKADDQTVSP